MVDLPRLRVLDASVTSCELFPPRGAPPTRSAPLLEPGWTGGACLRAAAPKVVVWLLSRCNFPPVWTQLTFGPRVVPRPAHHGAGVVRAPLPQEPSLGSSLLGRLGLGGRWGWGWSCGHRSWESPPPRAGAGAAPATGRGLYGDGTRRHTAGLLTFGRFGSLWRPGHRSVTGLSAAPLTAGELYGPFPTRALGNADTHRQPGNPVTGRLEERNPEECVSRPRAPAWRWAQSTPRAVLDLRGLGTTATPVLTWCAWAVNRARRSLPTEPVGLAHLCFVGSEGPGSQCSRPLWLLPRLGRVLETGTSARCHRPLSWAGSAPACRATAPPAAIPGWYQREAAPHPTRPRSVLDALGWAAPTRGRSPESWLPSHSGGGEQHPRSRSGGGESGRPAVGLLGRCPEGGAPFSSWASVPAGLFPRQQGGGGPGQGQESSPLRSLSTRA